MKEAWLMYGAVVPVDVGTTAALVAEIKRLIGVVGGMALKQPEQEPAIGDTRALKHRIHALEGEVIGYKQILDAQLEQEPVAWMVYTQEGQSVYVTDNPTDLQESQRALPLYTTPRQRKPLTKEVIYKLASAATGKDGFSEVDFARAIEAKLKEKNT